MEWNQLKLRVGKSINFHFMINSLKLSKTFSCQTDMNVDTIDDVSLNSSYVKRRE